MGKKPGQVTTVRVVIEGQDRDKTTALAALLKSAVHNKGAIMQALGTLETNEVMTIARSVHGDMYRRLSMN